MTIEKVRDPMEKFRQALERETENLKWTPKEELKEKTDEWSEEADQADSFLFKIIEKFLLKVSLPYLMIASLIGIILLPIIGTVAYQILITDYLVADRFYLLSRLEIFLSLVPYILLSIIVTYLSLRLAEFLVVQLLSMPFLNRKIGYTPYNVSANTIKVISRALIPFAMAVCFAGLIGPVLLNLAYEIFGTTYLSLNLPNGLSIVLIDFHAAKYFLFIPLVPLFVFPVYFIDELRVVGWRAPTGDSFHAIISPDNPLYTAIGFIKEFLHTTIGMVAAAKITGLFGDDDPNITEMKSSASGILTYYKGIFGIGTFAGFTIILQQSGAQAIEEIAIVVFKSLFRFSSVFAAVVFATAFFYWRFEKVKGGFQDKLERAGQGIIQLTLSELGEQVSKIEETVSKVTSGVTDMTQGFNDFQKETGISIPGMNAVNSFGLNDATGECVDTPTPEVTAATAITPTPASTQEQILPKVATSSTEVLATSTAAPPQEQTPTSDKTLDSVSSSSSTEPVITTVEISSDCLPVMDKQTSDLMSDLTSRIPAEFKAEGNIFSQIAQIFLPRLAGKAASRLMEDKISDMLTQSISKVAGGQFSGILSRTLTPIAEKVERQLGGIVETTGAKVVDIVGRNLPEVMESATDKLTDISEKHMSEMIDKAGTTIIEVTDKQMHVLATKAAKKVGDIVASKLPPQRRLIPNVTRQAEKQFSSILEATGDRVIEETKKHMVEIVNQSIKNISNLTEKEVTQILDKTVKGLTSTVEDYLPGLLSTSVNAASREVEEQIIAVLTSSSTALTDELGKHLPDIINTTVKELKGINPGNFPQILTSMAGGFASVASKELPSIMVNTVNGLSDILEEHLPDFMDDIIQNITEVVTANMPQIFDNTVTDLTELSYELPETIKLIFLKTLETTTKEMSIIMSKKIGLLAQAGELHLYAVTSEIVPDLADKGENNPVKVVEAITKAAEQQLPEVGAKIIQEISTEVEQFIPTVLANTITGFGDVAEEIVPEIVAGLVADIAQVVKKEMPAITTEAIQGIIDIADEEISELMGETVEGVAVEIKKQLPSIIQRATIKNS